MVSSCGRHHPASAGAVRVALGKGGNAFDASWRLGSPMCPELKPTLFFTIIYGRCVLLDGLSCN